MNMLGKFNAEQIGRLIKLIKNTGGKIEKEFKQSRVLFVMQDGRVYGDLHEGGVLDLLLKFGEKIDFSKNFRLYLLSARYLVDVKNISPKDCLEFSYMTYRGFYLAYEFARDRIDLIEDLLRSKRLPVDLWQKPGFQIYRWETQVFDISGDVREIV